MLSKVDTLHLVTCSCTESRPTAMTVQVAHTGIVLVTTTYYTCSLPYKQKHVPTPMPNKVLEIIRNMKLGWTPDIVGSTGEKFVLVVADTLQMLITNSFITELVHCPPCSVISRGSTIGREISKKSHS